MSLPINRKHEHEMIKTPGRRLLHEVPLRTVRKRAAGGGRRDVNVSLSLTSFIDFLVVVVVFLLMSFSASGEIPPDKSVKLPSAQNTADMTNAPMVIVSGTQVLLDGIPTGSVRPILENGQMARIDGLADMLRKKREFWRQLNPGQEFPGAVVLQVDRSVPAVVVKSVFRTAAESGYPHVSFLVRPVRKGA